MVKKKVEQKETEYEESDFGKTGCSILAMIWLCFLVATTLFYLYEYGL